MSAPLLAAIREAAAQPAATGHCFVAGLDLKLQAADTATVRWALCYLAPLIQAARQPTRRRYSASYLYSDQIVQLAIGHLQGIELVPIRRPGRDSYLRRAQPAPHIVVYVDPDEGMLWVSDLSRKCGFATFLDPRGGRPASAGLGALMGKRCGAGLRVDPLMTRWH